MIDDVVAVCGIVKLLPSQTDQIRTRHGHPTHRHDPSRLQKNTRYKGELRDLQSRIQVPVTNYRMPRREGLRLREFQGGFSHAVRVPTGDNTEEPALLVGSRRDGQ